MLLHQPVDQDNFRRICLLLHLSVTKEKCFKKKIQEEQIADLKKFNELQI